MRKALAIICGLLPTISLAATDEGFITAGGVGMIKCPVYVNALAEARQIGLTTSQGLNHVNAFVQYAFGFFTAYNASTDGVFDVLHSLRGDTMHVSILTMAGTFCEAHPTKVVDDALVDIVVKILPAAAHSSTD